MRPLPMLLAFVAALAPTPAFAAQQPPPATAIVSGQKQPLSIAVNEDRALTLTATGSNGAPIDLTGATVVLTIKAAASDASPLVSRLCSSSAPTTGVETCIIAHSDALAAGVYSYDIWETDSSGNQVRLVPQSKLTLVEPLWMPGQTTTGIAPVPITLMGAPAVTHVEGAALTEHADGGVSWQVPDSLPSQTGESGKYLTTDGSSASWATLQCLPDQTSQAGSFLSTDGTTAAWTPIDFTAGGDLSGVLDAARVVALQGHGVGNIVPTDGQVLAWNASYVGQLSGQMQFASIGNPLFAAAPPPVAEWVPKTLTASDVGAVASVSAGTGLTATGTTSITVSMPLVGTAGTYAICGGSITTDAEGRVTAASASSGSPVLLSPGSQQTGDVNVSGTVTAGTAVNTPAMRNAGSSVAIGGNGTDVSTALVVSSSTSGSVSVNEGSPGAANLYIGDNSNALNLGRTDNPLSMFGRTTFKSALFLATVQVTDANYTTNREDVISYSSLTAPRTITASSSLPGGSSSERIWIVHDESGNASASNTITWAPATGTIDGQSSEVIINKPYGAVTILGNGAAFYVVGRN